MAISDKLRFLLLSALGSTEQRNELEAILDDASDDMEGPSSATDNAIARFDGVTGKLLQNSLAVLSDTGSLSGIQNLTSTGQLISAAGSAASPSYSFTGDLDLGIYRTAADTLGFSAGGVLRASLATNQLNLSVPIYTTDGSVTEPSCSFALDPNTGTYRVSSDVLGISTGGSQSAYFDSSGISFQSTVSDLTSIKQIANAVSSGTVRQRMQNSDNSRYFSFATTFDAAQVPEMAEHMTISSDTTTIVSFARNGQLFLNASLGTASAPEIVHKTDPNTGIFWPADGVVAVASNGSEKARFDSTGALITGRVTTSGSGADTTSVSQLAGTTTGTVRQYFRNSDSTRSFEFDADFSSGTEALILQSDTTTIASVSRAGQLQMVYNGIASAPAYAFGTTAEKKASGMFFASSGVNISHDSVHTAFFSKNGTQILGTNTNDSASAGYVGQYVESTGGDSAWAAATDVYDNVATISLTAGDWEVSASCVTYNANAAGLTLVTFGISSDATATSFTDRADGRNTYQATGQSVAGYTATAQVPNLRVSLSATTSYYMKLNLSFAGGTPHVAGYKLSARRVR